MQLFLTINFSLIPAVELAAGLGQLAILSEEGSSPPAGGVVSAGSAQDVADLLAANAISAEGAAQGTAAFSQGFKPPIIWYGTWAAAGDAADALDALVAAEIDFGVAVISSIADADIVAVATWLGTGERALNYLIFAESTNAGLITATKPVSLVLAELNGIRMLWSNGVQGIAGGAGGTFSGKGLADGPATAEVLIAGVALPTETNAELAFALENDVGVLLQVDNGAHASSRAIRGVTTYGGVSFTAQATLLYVVRVMRAGIANLKFRKLTLNEPILSNSTGEAEVVAAINPQLAALAGANRSHFNPGTSLVNNVPVTLANGYRVTAVASGSNITATVLVRLVQEIFTVTINGIGEVT